MKENQDLIQTIIEGIQEKKGKQIITADLSEIESSSAQYFIICQGGSPAQVAAIADSVRETTLQKIGVKPFNNRKKSVKPHFLRPHGPVIFYLCNYSYSGYFSHSLVTSPRM